MLIKLLKEMKKDDVVLAKDSIIEMDEKTANEYITAKDAELYTEEVKKVEEKEVEVKVQETVKKEKKVMSEIEVTRNEPKYKSLGHAIKALVDGSEKELSILDTKAVTGLNETTAADGGNLINHEMTKLYDYAFAGAIIAPKCQKWTIGSNSNGVKIPYLDNSGAMDSTSTPRGYWLAEGAQKTATKITFGQHDLTMKKLVYYVPLTDEIIQDVSYLTSYVTNQVRGQLARMVDYAILNLSTATSGMIGIFDAAGANFLTAPVAHAATYTPAIIHDLVSGILPELRGNCEFYMSNDAWANIMGVLGVGATVSTLPLVNISEQTILGYPVNVVPTMAQFGETGDILFGDFGSGYVLADKGDVKIDTDSSIRFDYDETVLRLVYRVCGAPVIREQTIIDTTTVAAFSTTS